jgi:hypothetical protein
MSFEPRGYAKKLIDAMRAADDPLRIWTPDEAGQAMGVERRFIAARLRAVVQAGLIHAHYRSARRVDGYSLELPAAETEFSAQLWSDGDMVCTGLEVGDDGRVLIKREQLAAIKRLVMGQVVP